jgi:hypothetical protein
MAECFISESIEYVFIKHIYLQKPKKNDHSHDQNS